MEKRVTIKDIARAAGVSVATVSYVLNNRQDQKISNATKARVLQIVSDMGYTGPRVPKHTAQRTGLIAICSGAENGTLLQADHGLLLPFLVRHIERNGFSSLVLSAGQCEKSCKADAIIYIDAAGEPLRKTVQHNSVPVVELNGYSLHPLTCRVNIDYSQVMRRAQSEFGFDFCVVTCDPQCESLREYISSECGSDVFFCRGWDDLSDFLKKNGSRPLAVVSTTAYRLCAASGASAICVAPNPDRLADNTVSTARLLAAGHHAERSDVFVL